MTPKEALAFRHVSGTMKVTARSDLVAQEEVKGGSSHLRGLLSDDPEVLRLTRDGYNAFADRATNPEREPGTNCAELLPSMQRSGAYSQRSAVPVLRVRLA